MTERNYIRMGISELETLWIQYMEDCDVLHALNLELSFRKTGRAKKLNGLVIAKIFDSCGPKKGPGTARQAASKLERDSAKWKLSERPESFWINELMKLTPEKFERVVAGAFHRVLGFVIHATPKTGDGGIDGIGVTLRGTPAVLQAKQWEPGSKVGVNVVRELRGSMADFYVEYGMIVTTAKFTKGTIEYAMAQPISLYDGSRLARIMVAASATNPRM